MKKQKYIKINNNRKRNEMNKDKEQSNTKQSDNKLSMLGVAWSVFFALLLLIKDVVFTFLKFLFTCLIPLAIWLLTKFIGWLRQPDKPQKDTPTHNNETRVDNKERARSTAVEMQGLYNVAFEAAFEAALTKAAKEQLEFDIQAKQRITDLQLANLKTFMEEYDKIQKEAISTGLIAQQQPAMVPAQQLDWIPVDDPKWWHDERNRKLAILGAGAIATGVILGPMIPGLIAELGLSTTATAAAGTLLI